MRRWGGARGAWVQVVVGLALLSSCKGPQSSRDGPGPAAGVPIEAPARTENTADSGSEGAADASESGRAEAGDPGTDTTARSETGTSETGASEAPGARLCSRPFVVSSSPGKGSRSADDEPSAAADAAARKRLEQGLEVSIDELPPQPWTTEVGVSFDGLDPAAEHRIEIRDSRGKSFKRLVLDFERRGSEDLCLGMNSFYGSLQLRALRPGARCGPCTTRPR